MMEKICEYCKKPFSGSKTNQDYVKKVQRFCSRKCGAMYREKVLKRSGHGEVKSEGK